MSLKLRTNMARRLEGAVPSPYLVSARHMHSSKADRNSMSAQAPAQAMAYLPKTMPKRAALSVLPLSTILRTYLITSVSSKPALLKACFKILTGMLHAKNPLFNIERNPLLKLVLRETFYKQFCGGETKAEVQATRAHLNNLGYTGVIFEYAREVLESDAGASDAVKDVEAWRTGIMQTVDAAQDGDFIGLKWSGMGTDALQLLKNGSEPTPLMAKAMREICDAASAKHVSLVPSAEETTTNPTIEAWTMWLQKIYNKPDNIVLYNTYQCYLKSAPAQMAKHLAEAKKEGYTLGVKLVRGAYLHSEPRNLIWDTIQDTHTAYDAMAEACLKRQYNDIVKPATDDKSFPKDIGLVLATHNADSVRKAQGIRTEQLRAGEERVPLAYAQLQGMADEVSCELISATKASPDEKVDIPRAYKLTAWGSMTDCLNYLLRRAAENKDAASRTIESRDAMSAEIRRRIKVTFGLA